MKRLQELEGKIRKEKEELEKRERRLEASISKLRSEVEESLRNDFQLFKECSDKPISWGPSNRAHLCLAGSPQTVTFDSFVANFNNADGPGGGDVVLDLDSGFFTCFTPRYYTVSFSAFGYVGQLLYLLVLVLEWHPAS